MVLAADRPDLVRALAVVEADPEENGERTFTAVERWLRSWPLPFPSRVNLRRVVQFLRNPEEREQSRTSQAPVTCLS